LSQFERHSTNGTGAAIGYEHSSAFGISIAGDGLHRAVVLKRNESRGLAAQESF